MSKKKILLVSGHTSGHNYCKATGVNEGDLNIDMVKRTAKLLAPYADVMLYPIERDMYKDNANGCLKVNLRAFDYIFEWHHNASNGQARGTSVQLHTNYRGGISVEQTIANNLAAIGFKKRGTNGIVRRSDLLNMRTCLAIGVDYALLETCFYDNAADMAIYNANKQRIAEAVANGIISAFSLSGGGVTGARAATVVGCTALNVRETPNGTIMGSVRGGSTVYIIGSGKDSDGDTWHKVQAGSMVGYVWPKYIG